MLAAAYLVYVITSPGYGTYDRTYPEPSMEVCMQAVKSAQSIVTREKDGIVTLFCSSGPAK
jgi:hypothetical protein